MRVPPLNLYLPHCHSVSSINRADLSHHISIAVGNICYTILYGRQEYLQGEYTTLTNVYQEERCRHTTICGSTGYRLTKVTNECGTPFAAESFL